MIRAAVYGYGNLGRGATEALLASEDFHLTGVFTRRNPAKVGCGEGIPLYPAADFEKYASETDVVLLTGGSKEDLPRLTPLLAQKCHVIDSFDTHAAMAAHFAATDRAGRESGHLALIAAGWDPGLFSLARLYMESVFPAARAVTFWGRGVSQGHSDAVRQIDGVLDAREYTLPDEKALAAARAGEKILLPENKKHTRLCYVVAKAGADREKIARKIREMPHYFAGYETEIRFISENEMREKHAAMPHGGSVICTGETGANERQRMEYRLSLDSNPAFTGRVMVAFARAVYRLSRTGMRGCITVFDIPPAFLSPWDAATLRQKLL